MPVVFVHGVAVRDQSAVPGIEQLVRRYICPSIAPNDVQNVPFIPVFWGDLGATFAWKMASLPNGGTNASMGAAATSVGADATALLSVGDQLPRPRPTMLPQTSGESAAMGSEDPAAMPQIERARVDTDQASDLFAGALAHAHSGTTDAAETLRSSTQSQNYGLAAAALDDAVRELSRDGAITLDAENLRAIEQRALKRVIVPETVGSDSAQGVRDDLAQLIHRAVHQAGQVVQAAQDAAGSAMAAALLRARRPLNEFVTLFTGDVLAYLAYRDGGPQGRPIIQRVLDALRAAADAQKRRPGEPLVVLTHSMGGQLVYDTLTYYLDRAGEGYADIVVDFWATAASQVGLFEEMKFFKLHSDDYGAAKGNRAPFPNAKRLRYWWNVWDPNDFLSYTAEPIFTGVHDHGFMSDASPLQAHGAYLVLPRFYQEFAAELEKALER